MVRFAGIRLAATCGLLALATTATTGQSSAPAGRGAIIGTGTFTSFVENMDRSLAFYHDVFGLEVPVLPASGERPYNNPNPQLFAMFDMPGAKERHQSARLPGTRTSVEVMEVQNVDHKTVDLRIQDPGNATLVFLVRDVDGAVARVRQAGVSIVTPGEKAVTLGDGDRAVLIRDLDKRFIELRQPASMPETVAQAAGNIVGVELSIAVGDMERTKQVYRDVLGFSLEGETAFSADNAWRGFTGLAKAEMRRSRVKAPGSTLGIEFVEYRGVDRTPLRMRIQDRGAARLQLRTQNIDAMVGAMKNAGLTVVSQGGGPVPIPPNFRGALVADPNNFFLTPFEPCDGCSPTLPRPSVEQH